MHSTLFTLLLFFVPLCFGIEICPSREITASSGRITSVGYPNPYASFTDCVLTIRQPLDTKITFTFTKMDLEGEDDSCYDGLEIQGKEFCSTALPAPYTPSLNIVKLHMTSDDSIQQTGFDLTFTTVRTPNLPTPVVVCPTREVTATQIGRIMTPAFPENYGDNLDCKLTLKIPPNKKTKISYVFFSIDYIANCANDKLLITSAGGQQQSVCGTGSPQSKVFEGREVYLHFTTNGNTNNIGFMLNYSLRGNSCACPDGAQYIKRLLPRNNMVKRQNDDISLEFKTTEPNGLFLYGKGSVRDYILLKLVNGTLDFEVDLGTGVAKVHVVSKNLNDNEWHSVVVQRRGRVITVSVNDGSSQAIKVSPGSFTHLDIKGSNAALYVLGGPSGIPFQHNFKGCVKNLIVDAMKPIEAVQRSDPSYALYGLSVLNKCNST